MITLLKRDLKLAFRSIYSLLAMLAFYFIGCFIFLFAFSQDDSLLKDTFPAIIIINAIMAGILTIPELIRRDYETKILEQIYLQSVPMGQIIFSKIIAHWLTTGISLTLFAALCSLFVKESTVLKTSLAIFFATPLISIIAVLTSSITIGVRNGGMIAAIIAIPLYIPLILFSLINISNSDNAIGLTVASVNIIGLMMVLLPLCIFVGGFSLKLAIED